MEVEIAARPYEVLGIAGRKVFDVEIGGRDRKQAEALLKRAADQLLANTVIENYDVEVLR